MALRLSRDGRWLLALTRLRRVLSWDLAGLSSALDANGLRVSCLHERSSFASVGYER